MLLPFPRSWLTCYYMLLPFPSLEPWCLPHKWLQTNNLARLVWIVYRWAVSRFSFWLSFFLVTADSHHQGFHKCNELLLLERSKKFLCTFCFTKALCEPVCVQKRASSSISARCDLTKWHSKGWCLRDLKLDLEAFSCDICTHGKAFWKPNSSFLS